VAGGFNPKPERVSSRCSVLEATRAFGFEPAFPQPRRRKNGVDKPAGVVRVRVNNMKKSSLIPAMTGVLLVLTVFLAVATYASIHFSRKSRRMQSQVAIMNNTRLFLDALAREAVAYSQTNHAIDPILISVKLKPGQAAPAAKPPTR
jgi:hypothetical protein